MSNHRYVPILRAKNGEFRALQALAPKHGDRITPMFEVQPIPRPSVNSRTGAPGTPKTLARFLSETAHKIATNTQSFSEVWIDDKVERPDVVPGTTSHPLQFIFSELSFPGREIVPAVSLARNATYTTAATSIAADVGRLVIRLAPRDLEDIPRSSAKVDALMRDAGLSASAIDMVLDVAGINPDLSGTTQAVIAGIIPRIPYLADWRTFTLAITSFPVTPGSVVANGSVSELARACWHTWSEMTRRGLPRIPAFGDYAVDNPGTEIDLAYARAGIPMIRYSTDRHWLLLRGTGSRDARGIGYPQLARDLIARPEYKGPSYSAGDKFIENVATGATGPGNPEGWRFAAVSHHLTQVAEQLSSHP